MINLNNIPTSNFDEKDRCPGCGDACNIFTDLDDHDYCNNCRPKNISAILAMSENLTIGKGNDLPWNLPSDLKKFKEITLNSIIIMGNKCYESIGRPLPKRENVILSRNVDLVIEGCVVFNSFSAIFSHFKNDPRGIFIIGGAIIYEQAFDFCDNLYLTLVEGDVEGDVKVKGLDLSKWNLVEESETYTENQHNFKLMKFIK